MTFVKYQVFKFILFADDKNLLCCHSDLNELVRMINTGLDQLQVWSSVNRLSLNVTKTNYMFFGNRKLTVDISVKINKETINRVNVTKFLGMYRASFLIDRRVCIFCTIFSCRILCIGLKYGATHMQQMFNV